MTLVAAQGSIAQNVLAILLTLVAAPLGIMLGCFRANRTISKGAEAEAEQARVMAERERAVEVGRVGSRLAMDIRSLGHGLGLYRHHNPKPAQYRQLMDGYNRSRVEFRERLLEIPVLGPGLLGPPRRLNLRDRCGLRS